MPDRQRPFESPERRVALAVVAVPFVGFLGALWALWGQLVGPAQVVALVVMYVATGLGVTMGYHRLFAHRSFATGPRLRAALAILGSMASEGPPIFWTAVHRCHHQHSDRPDDPHSPHHHGGGVRGLLLGLWHAHAGWMFVHVPEDLVRYTPDLLRDRALLKINRLYVVWVVLGLLAPAAIAGLAGGTARDAALGFLWGGLARTFLVHHVTWSVNSICHVYGSRPFGNRDESTNNAVCALLGLGEGWHNNHHAFPSSARHGLEWWQVDVTYLAILLLEQLGLAWDVRVPREAELATKRAFAAGSQ